MKKFIVLFIALLLLPLAGCLPTDNSGDKSDDIFKKNHTVSLVLDSYSYKEIKVDDGDVLVVDFTPSKTNYIFNGWYTDSACTVPYDFSRPVTTNFNLYAGYVLSTKIINCGDTQVKALSVANDNYKTFYVSLVGFDYNYLEKNGMGLLFTISYDVKYKKDYDVLWDIGYAGSPKYELSLINSSLIAYMETNLPTTTKEVHKSYSCVTALSFAKGKEVELIFSTDNVQNIIYFTDIVVTIDAIKIN